MITFKRAAYRGGLVLTTLGHDAMAYVEGGHVEVWDWTGHANRRKLAIQANLHTTPDVALEQARLYLGQRVLGTLLEGERTPPEGW